jgi:hypothetical protein
MDSKYYCEICGTNPDQLSHHKSHLKTQKHKNNCANFVIDMKIFSLVFRQVHPKKWYETEYNNYIIEKYMESTEENVIDNDEVSKWIQKEAMTYGNGKYDWSWNCFNGVTPMVCYENETGCKVENPIDLTNIEYNNWCIQKILQYKETIQSKPERRTFGRMIDREHNRHRASLSRYTPIKFNKLSDIRNGAFDVRYLIKPKHMLKFLDCDMEIYNDDVVRYSSLLFYAFGIQQSLYPLYNGLCGTVDIEEHPEERKHNSFYFYKEMDVEYSTKIANVSNYGETRVEKRKIWVSCYMGDFIDWLDDLENTGAENIQGVGYIHISNEDFKYFIKESLIELFSNKIESITHYIQDDPFSFKWKKSNERIVYDRFTQSYYLISNDYMGFYRNDVMFMENKHTDEERPVDSSKKLTEEQCKEYNDRKEHIANLEEEIKYHKMEIVKIKEFSLSSDMIKSIMHLCEYFFEYNEDLIEYYKHHMSCIYINIEKENMEKQSLMEE